MLLIYAFMDLDKILVALITEFRLALTYYDYSDSYSDFGDDDF